MSDACRRSDPLPAMRDPEVVIWHDLECGTYDVDLGFWRTLADRHPGPILDIGAGSGRVALDLARAGHQVTALDLDPELLAAIDRRRGELPVRTVCADARAFSLPQRFGLCIVPMQSVQLMEGSAGRRALLGRAREHLTGSGVIALAIADTVEPFDIAQGTPAPLPDVTEIDGTVYFSHPTAVRSLPDDRYMLERLREVVTPDGRLRTERDEIVLDLVTPGLLEQDGRAVGLTVLEAEVIPATAEYVGSAVVVFGA